MEDTAGPYFSQDLSSRVFRPQMTREKEFLQKKLYFSHPGHKLGGGIWLPGEHSWNTGLRSGVGGSAPRLGGEARLCAVLKHCSGTRICVDSWHSAKRELGTAGEGENFPGQPHHMTGGGSIPRVHPQPQLCGTDTLDA